MPVSDKPARHNLIKQFISSEKISTQGRLVELLAAEGKIVTQATVSRDLQELGVYTDRAEDGKGVYVVPENIFGNDSSQTRPVREQLQRVLSEWTNSVDTSGNLIILKTPPGSAHVIASALDRSKLPGVLATIAGDDTLLIVVSERKESSRDVLLLAREIKELAGIQN